MAGGCGVLQALVGLAGEPDPHRERGERVSIELARELDPGRLVDVLHDLANLDKPLSNRLVDRGRVGQIRPVKDGGIELGAKDREAS